METKFLFRFMKIRVHSWTIILRVLVHAWPTHGRAGRCGRAQKNGHFSGFSAAFSRPSFYTGSIGRSARSAQGFPKGCAGFQWFFCPAGAARTLNEAGQKGA